MTSPPPASLNPAESSPLSSLASLLLGFAGGALVASRRRWHDDARGAAMVAGIALIGAAANRPLIDALRRAGARRRSADVRMSFLIAQPVERVFGFCRDFENFPRFFGALREVRDFGDGRSHWCASTPTGGTVEWDTVITKYVPNHVIAWRTVGHAMVDSTGLLRFHPEDDGTCVHLVLTYSVNDGHLVDAIAALTTRGPREKLEADVRTLARFIETASESELAEVAR